MATGTQINGQGDAKLSDAKDKERPEADSFEEWVEWKKWKAKQEARPTDIPGVPTISRTAVAEPAPTTERKKDSDLQQTSPEIKTKYVLAGQPTGWAAMEKMMRDFDEEKLNSCKEDIDTLLVFVSDVVFNYDIAFLTGQSSRNARRVCTPQCFRHSLLLHFLTSRTRQTHLV